MPNREELEEILSVYIHVGRTQLPAAPAKYYATFFQMKYALTVQFLHYR